MYPFKISLYSYCLLIIKMSFSNSFPDQIKLFVTSWLLTRTLSQMTFSKKLKQFSLIFGDYNSTAITWIFWLGVLLLWLFLQHNDIKAPGNQVNVHFWLSYHQLDATLSSTFWSQTCISILVVIFYYYYFGWVELLSKSDSKLIWSRTSTTSCCVLQKQSK